MTGRTRSLRSSHGQRLRPAGSVLITVATLLLGAPVLFLASLASRGKPERNFATADLQDLRSVIWASEETWRASHRANAPWLFAAAAGMLVGGAIMVGAMVASGAAGAVGLILAVLIVALGWAVVCCIAAGIAGRIAAKRVLARDR